MQKGIRDDLYERPTKASAEYFIGKTLIIGGKSDMDAGSIKLAQGVGGQKVSFPGALSAEDDLALLASTRECTRNGSPEKKEGFYQYSAAWDSKHRVTLAEGKTARVLFELQEMQDERSP